MSRKKAIAGLALGSALLLLTGFVVGGGVGFSNGVKRQQAVFAETLKSSAVIPGVTPAPAEILGSFQERFPNAELIQASQNTAYLFLTEGRTIVRIGDAWLEIPLTTPEP